VTDYSVIKIQAFVTDCLDQGLTTKARGDALESLVCYLLDELSGVKTKPNAIDRSQSCEIDVIVVNCQDGWMTHYPKLFFVECKNWGKPVDSKALRDFAGKMDDRSVEAGVLVSTNGITGDPDDLTAAHQVIVTQQAKGRRIVLLTLDQLRTLKTTSEFEDLLIERLLVTVGLIRQ
jgi:Restriction endonuclease